MKKANIEPVIFSRKRAHRVDENGQIDLIEYSVPMSAERVEEPRYYIPKEIKVSEEISGTVYDVTGIFTGKVNKSLFDQFKEIIISKEIL